MRRIAVLIAGVLALLVSVSGTAWANDGDEHSDARGPLDGTTCVDESGHKGNVETSFGAAERGARDIKFVCQSGQPVLKVEIFGLAIIGPGSERGFTTGTVSIEPSGKTCSGRLTYEDPPPPCIQTFHGDSLRVTLRAKPTGPISEFQGWEGEACAEAKGPVCVITMNHSKTVGAHFGLRETGPVLPPRFPSF